LASRFCLRCVGNNLFLLNVKPYLLLTSLVFREIFVHV
jgi:hypothetical protein